MKTTKTTYEIRDTKGRHLRAAMRGPHVGREAALAALDSGARYVGDEPTGEAEVYEDRIEVPGTAVYVRVVEGGVVSIVRNAFGVFEVSAELADGIARITRERSQQIDALGGIGARVRGLTPDGRAVVGTLAAAATPDQPPSILDNEGLRWRCTSIEVAS